MMAICACFYDQRQVHVPGLEDTDVVRILLWIRLYNIFSSRREKMTDANRQYP